jgi:hypothetical protein
MGAPIAQRQAVAPVIILRTEASKGMTKRGGSFTITGVADTLPGPRKSRAKA